MCVEVDYHCICGVAVHTERMACNPSLADPLAEGHEENHQIHHISLVLPRDEWSARLGKCGLEVCAMNQVLSGSSGDLCKCPGCSTIVGDQDQTPLDHVEFLDHALWGAHECPVAFCPFNTPSMVSANQQFADLLERMRQVSEADDIWAAGDDERILELSLLGANDELIANAVGRTIPAVQDRLEYLRLLKEVFG